MLETPIEASLLEIVSKVADCSTAYQNDSSILVRTLVGDAVAGGTPSFTYSISNNFVSDAIVIDYSRVSLLVPKNAKIPDFDVSHLDKSGAALSPTDEEKLLALLDQFKDRITTTRILLPSDINLSAALQLISWFVPSSTRCM